MLEIEKIKIQYDFDLLEIQKFNARWHKFTWIAVLAFHDIIIHF